MFAVPAKTLIQFSLKNLRLALEVFSLGYLMAWYAPLAGAEGGKGRMQ